MIESNQTAIPGASTNPLRLAAVRPVPAATDRAPIAASPTFAVQDLNWSLIAADLVHLGGRPEEVFRLPGMDKETATEMAGLMEQHLAARPGRVFRPPLYVVPDPRPEPTAAELDAATDATAATIGDLGATLEDIQRAAALEEALFLARDQAAEAEAEAELELEI